jgi:hypothetical protein
MKKGTRGLADFIGKSNHTVLPEFEKSKMHIIVEIIENVPNAVISRPVIKKTTGNIVDMSFDTDEELPEETSSFRYLYSGNKWRG